MKPSPAPLPATARPPSEGRSSNVSSQHNGSGLATAVEKRLETQRMMNDIAEGRRVLAEENGHMEEMLSEKHHMVTNVDLAAILSNAFVNKSAILETRKPVERLSLRFKGLTSEEAIVKALPQQQQGSSEGVETRAVAIVDHAKLLSEATAKEEALRRASLVRRGLIPQDSKKGASLPPSGKVNYAAMLEQQRDMAESCDVQRRIYHTMIKEYVKNSNLGDRFSGIL
jgi:hypothetical protein